MASNRSNNTIIYPLLDSVIQVKYAWTVDNRITSIYMLNTISLAQVLYKAQIAADNENHLAELLDSFNSVIQSVLVQCFTLT